MRITERLVHGWNAFKGEPGKFVDFASGPASYGRRPDRMIMRFSNERSIIASIYNRISTDVAAIDIRHVRTDDQGRYLEDIDSGLNQCLTLRANIDQGARAFKQDMVMSMFEHGHMVVVPIDTTLNPKVTGGYDIKSMRVGKVVAWYPKMVKVEVYNEATGMREDVVVDKDYVNIVENPFYTVMNEPNSTLQRLIAKLNILDTIDKQSGSGKLDIIIQLPYTLRNDKRRGEAEKRRSELESQMQGSQYGVGYVDATEKITQLNRPAENNLFRQVEYLTEQLYDELGVTKEVLAGTADEATMLNYYNRTVEPILAAIQEGMLWTFLTKTARSQKQSIMFFRDPFKLVPITQIAEIADKFTRNEIATGNEVRGWIGMRPAKDKTADELRNKNIPEAEPSKDEAVKEEPSATSTEKLEEENQNGST